MNKESREIEVLSENIVTIKYKINIENNERSEAE